MVLRKMDFSHTALALEETWHLFPTTAIAMLSATANVLRGT